MKTLLEHAGKTFLKVFLAGLLVVAIGISAQPNLNGAVAVGIAGVMAALAAGLSAVQVFVPQFTFVAYVPKPWGPLLDAFVHAFFGAFLTAIIGLLAEPSLAAWKALLVGAIVGAINAGLRAVQGALTPGDTPVAHSGLTVPAPPET